MLSVFRAPDGQVTVVDTEIGTVIAPSEIEARLRTAVRKSTTVAAG